MRQFLLKICIFASLFGSTIQAKQPVVARKTKLCADIECTEVLFKSKSTRNMPSNHPMFLNVIPDMVLNVVGIRFSDRLDIMEALTDAGIRGTFYNTAIDKGAYVEFLRDAVTNKRTMYFISQDPNDVGEKRIVGTLQADKDLVRTYNVEAKNYAILQGIPAPEEIPLPVEPTAGHGHSHGGHGHSHGGHAHSHEGHAHSHDDGHGHAHSHQEEVKQTPEPVATAVNPNAEPAVEATTPTPVTLPPVVPQAAEPVKAENPALNQAAPAVPEAATIPVAAAVPVAPEIPAVNTNVPTPVEHVHSILGGVAASPIVEESVNNIEPPKNKMTIDEIQAEVERLEREDKQKQAEALAAAEKLKAAVPTPVPTVDHEMERLMSEEKRKRVEAHAAAEKLKNAAPPPVPTVDPEIERLMNENKIRLAEAQAAAEQATNATPPVPTLSTADIIGSAIPPKIVENVPTSTPSPFVEEVAAPPVEATPPVQETIVAPPTEAPVVLETHTNHHHHMNAHVHPPASEEVTTTQAPVVEEPPAFVPEDPKPTIAEEGFCHSDECENLKNQAQVPIEEVRSAPVYTTTTPAPVAAEDPFKANPFDDNFPPTDTNEFVEQLQETGRRPAKPSMISSVFNSVANLARSVWPLGDLSDAGVGVFLNASFVIAMVIVYLIGKLLSDGDDSHKDSRLSHDLTTKCIRLQEEVNQKTAELQRVSANAGRNQADAQETNNLRNELATAKHELQQTVTRLEQANADLQRERKEREAYENTQATIREKVFSA